MLQLQYFKNLSVPSGVVDVVIDSDAANELDDQFAISYLLRSAEKLNTVALYAAPYGWESGAKAAMERSYQEICTLLKLADMEKPVFFGSHKYLDDEDTPVVSDAAHDLAERANKYSPENPLYVIAIGAITNVASAIMLNKSVAENTVVVWLGGNAYHYHDTAEYNLYQDIAAVRVVMNSGVPFVQLPCAGVVSAFTVSNADFEYWFKGKNLLADYLYQKAISVGNRDARFKAWSRGVCDVTAIGWLLNDNNRFMLSRIVPRRLPDYNNQYLPEDKTAAPMCYVYHINRDSLFNDLIEKLCE